MAEENVSLGEVQRNVNRIDKRLDAFVTVDAWTRENDRMKERVAEVDKTSRERDDAAEEATDERFKRSEESGQNRWIRVLGILGIAATLFAAVWAAYLSSRGAH